MRRIENRLKDLEQTFQAGPPLDLDAAREYVRLKVSAYCLVWQTIPEEYQRLITRDLDEGDRAFNEGGTHTYNRLTSVFWQRVTETARKCVLPQAMPGPLCQAIIDFPDLCWTQDCEDCRAWIPFERVIVQGVKPRIIFEACPLCGGRIGWNAYGAKHKAPALSTLTMYGGFYHEFLKLEEAANAAIDALGVGWLKAAMAEAYEGDVP
ncbi:MAG: hypothetical protein SF339_18310 [Blastocatellia bacterium]|nr:hypothetical protein [Blastocatellia bacterium]